MTVLLEIHVWTAVASVASFALASAVALLYLVQLRHLKQKRFGRAFHWLPSLAVLDRLNLAALRAGLVTYVVSLGVGTVAAVALWSSWFWAPLKIVSLAVLGIYAVLAVILPRWTSRRRALGSVAAFSLVVGTLVILIGAGSTLHPTNP